MILYAQCEKKNLNGVIEMSFWYIFIHYKYEKIFFKNLNSAYKQSVELIRVILIIFEP
jgi:hypothetical protein